MRKHAIIILTAAVYICMYIGIRDVRSAKNYSDYAFMYNIMHLPVYVRSGNRFLKTTRAKRGPSRKISG